MTRLWNALFAVGVGLLLAAAPAIADKPETPWGKPVDGLACRLIVRENYCIGECITVVVEIKNVSAEKRLVLNRFNAHYPRHSKLAVTAPGGKPLKQLVRGRGSYNQHSFTIIAPGEVRRVELVDLRDPFPRTDLKKPGKYTLTYTHIGKDPRNIIAGRIEKVDGREVTVFTTPDGETAKSWAGTVVSNTATFTLTATTAEDLTIHEWGVFAVYNDAKYANADLSAEWAEMPEFFYRQFPRLRLRWSPAVWRKPIIYFHTKRASMKVKVEVTFAKGAPVIWWPACSKPLDTGGRGRTVTPKGVFRQLTWTAALGKRIPTVVGAGWKASPWIDVQEFEMPEECWLAKARNVKGAALVTTTGSKVERTSPWDTTRTETERFIYYDGLMPAPAFLRCAELTGKSVTLKNTAKFAIGELFVVDRRTVTVDGGGVRFAHVTKPLAAGTQMKIALAEAAADQWPVLGIKPLRKALLAAGLFADEVEAMLSIWKKGLFVRPGLTAFYILPRAKYNRMLPLKITPTPGAVVRVGLALHPRLERTAGIEKEARRLIAQLDSDDFNARQDASKALSRIVGSPAVLSLLRKTAKDTDSAEVRQRCEDLLKHVDFGKFLEPKKPSDG